MRCTAYVRYDVECGEEAVRFFIPVPEAYGSPPLSVRRYCPAHLDYGDIYPSDWIREVGRDEALVYEVLSS